MSMTVQSRLLQKTLLYDFYDAAIALRLILLLHSRLDRELVADPFLLKHGSSKIHNGSDAPSIESKCMIAL